MLQKIFSIILDLGGGFELGSSEEVNKFRPHQGLLLDAYPLQMVAIKELEPIAPAAPTILVLGSEGTELRPLVEMSDTELVRILGKISVDIIVGQDEDVECDNSISGQNYKSFMAVESLNISVATNVPGTSGADIHAALFCSHLKTSQNG
ncbi:hypothetical protein FXO37_25501 [Capsicum annuum]|nr:hypothetical protein FXO37_25501 [Capsicum annuum]